MKRFFKWALISLLLIGPIYFHIFTLSLPFFFTKTVHVLVKDQDTGLAVPGAVITAYWSMTRLSLFEQRGASTERFYMTNEQGKAVIPWHFEFTPISFLDRFGVGVHHPLYMVGGSQYSTWAGKRFKTIRFGKNNISENKDLNPRHEEIKILEIKIQTLKSRFKNTECTLVVENGKETEICSGEKENFRLSHYKSLAETYFRTLSEQKIHGIDPKLVPDRDTTMSEFRSLVHHIFRNSNELPDWAKRIN